MNPDISTAPEVAQLAWMPASAPPFGNLGGTTGPRDGGSPGRPGSGRWQPTRPDGGIWSASTRGARFYLRLEAGAGLRAVACHHAARLPRLVA